MLSVLMNLCKQEDIRECDLKWIDMVRVTFIGARITQPETTTQFIRMWIEYE